MLKLYRLHSLDRLQYIAKVNKYVADIQFTGMSKQTLWLSEKQAANLQRCMKGNAYSTKTNEVWVVLDVGGNAPRYVWADCNDAGRTNLIQRFGAAADE